VRPEGLGKLEKNHHIGMQSRELPVCNLVPQQLRYRVPPVTSPTDGCNETVGVLEISTPKPTLLPWIMFLILNINSGAATFISSPSIMDLFSYSLENCCSVIGRKYEH
jgi:hypothetical protein